jgi:hypothetical protein
VRDRVRTPLDSRDWSVARACAGGGGGVI